MNLTEGSILQLIKKIAIPASIGFFCSTMLNVIDTIFAGFISTHALASLSISFPVFFIIIAFNTGLSTGSSALISNALGEGNQHKVAHLSAQVISFSMMLYVFLAPSTIYLTPYLFQLLGAEGEYLELAVTYMNVILLGSIFFLLMYAANSILMAHGNTKYIRNFLASSMFINAALDPWFMYGGFGLPAMGLQGIALATVVTMLIGAAYIGGAVIRDGYFKQCTYSDFIPNKNTIIAIAKQSFPASLNMMTIGIGIIIITFFIKDFGTSAVAAYGITMRIEQIALLPTIGLTIAALSIIGQNNGAKKYDRIVETLKITLKYGIFVISVGAIAMICFPRQLVSLFTSDQNVVNIGCQYLRIAGITSWSYVIISVCISTLQGMKRPLFPLVLGLFRQIIFPPLVFYSLVVVLQTGITGVFWGIFSITWTGAVIAFVYTFYVLKKHVNPPCELCTKKTC